MHHAGRGRHIAERAWPSNASRISWGLLINDDLTNSSVSDSTTLLVPPSMALLKNDQPFFDISHQRAPSVPLDHFFYLVRISGLLDEFTHGS